MGHAYFICSSFKDIWINLPFFVLVGYNMLPNRRDSVYVAIVPAGTKWISRRHLKKISSSALLLPSPFIWNPGFAGHRCDLRALAAPSWGRASQQHLPLRERALTHLHASVFSFFLFFHILKKLYTYVMCQSYLCPESYFSKLHELCQNLPRSKLFSKITYALKVMCQSYI